MAKGLPRKRAPYRAPGALRIAPLAKKPRAVRTKAPMVARPPKGF